MQKKIKLTTNWPETLTLKNLVPSEVDIVSLRSMSKNQRLALFNLCEILRLTFYEKEMRAAAEALRETIRKNTLDPNYNKCDFDLTTDERKRLQSSPKKDNAE